MVEQILAYLVIIGITAISEIGMIRLSDKWIECDNIIWNILGFISGILGFMASGFTLLITIKCLVVCCSIIS